MGSGTCTYTANNLNEYTGAGTTSFQYDASGNMTADGTYTYDYDPENRVIRVHKSTPREFRGTGDSHGALACEAQRRINTRSATRGDSREPTGTTLGTASN
jgi:hypothetical protein